MIRMQGWFIALSILITGYLSSGVMAQDRPDQWVARVVSAQGSVQVRSAGDTTWLPAKLNDAFSPGDTIRIGERSRAAIRLPNETILRLDQNTTITFSGVEKKRTSLLDLLRGAVHFFSRTPRGLKVATPFVNGSVEGTEFFVRVEQEHTFLSIFEGRVAAANKAGSLILASGDSAIAAAGQAPARVTVVRPREAVQWALYYPPVLAYRPVDFPGGAETDWQAKVRKSLEFYWEGDLAGAFSGLETVSEDVRDPRFFTFRAGLLLTVGRVDDAIPDIEKALALDPSNSQAIALKSVVALVQNQKDRANDLAEKAVDLDPKSAAARVALSYALQANFDLQGALDSLQEATKIAPENALTWARMAEIWLSLGYLDKALEAAQKAVSLNPNLARTQIVLGFAYLTQIKTKDAKATFEKAIELDQAAPLPRLGLGLARIREGRNIEAGRDEIAIAASLDPNNALIRSYLGKAYFEEKRDTLAADQYIIAKELDPLDPTPWFYDAIRKQTVNRPVEALQDLQKSIELNDNRAVYRSRLLLDEDLAARSASLGRIYRDLGFEQLALVGGWKSLNTDPANYSGHRFLADSYSALPRHEIARVSELLQSQLLQPINITPVQPHLAESNVFVLEGAGPSDPSFNEFNPLFNRNRFAFQGSGVLGGNDTLGEELVHSAVWGKMSYSIGQLHYETDGYRENNDQEQDIYNVFAQVGLSHKTSLQAEFRYKETEKGDLPLRFDPTNFSDTLRQEEQLRSIRLGLHHAFAPHSDLIASFISLRGDADSDLPPVLEIETEEAGYMVEAQYLFRSDRFRITGGMGYFDSDEEEVTTLTLFPPFPLPPMTVTTTEEYDNRHTNVYVYPQINYPENVTWTIGASADFLNGAFVDRDQFNPKFGLIWNPLPSTTLRGAAFRVLKRTLISNQTIEPTQVAGFNQFFDDIDGTDMWRYGIGIDQKFSPTLFGGLELSRKEMEVPFISLASGKVQRTDEEEDFARAYVYWTPLSCLALRAEYQFERFERDPESPGEEAIVEVETHRFPLGLSYFHPSGFSAGLRATYIDQKGDFVDSLGEIVPGDDQFWIFDASVGYRLPKRYGLITVEIKNLFDEEFKYQDMEFRNPVISPERLILARLTLSF